jgi:hypothetical protein
MLANKNIFCNTPWYEIHIYWDGSYGICCQEAHKLYPDNKTEYNIKTMSLAEWFNSEPARNFRNKILENSELSECQQCMIEESDAGNSRRFKSNQKSVIFTRIAFDTSFGQSPGHKHFEFSRNNHGQTTTHPIDLHIDLGNFCNLACKMCNASASSTIASQHVRWGIQEDRKFLGVDWTKDIKVWNNFKQQLLDIPKLNNIHFMGGETILTDKFENLVDTLIENNRLDVCLSFVTNGTIFKPSLVEKLAKFRRVGIEVSIETLGRHNEYIRQGTVTDIVLENISKYRSYCNNNSITVALRPAPSLLSVGHYVDLLQYALDNQFVVKSNICYKPSFLNIQNLPSNVKNNYKEKYIKFLKQFDSISALDYNASDPHEVKNIIKEQAELCLSLLNKNDPADIITQHKLLVEHCKKWDTVYKLNAQELYPELAEIWDKYGY